MENEIFTEQFRRDIRLFNPDIKSARFIKRGDKRYIKIATAKTSAFSALKRPTPGYTFVLTSGGFSSATYRVYREGEYQP